MKHAKQIFYLFLVCSSFFFFTDKLFAQATAVKIPEEILESYTGRYALGSNFILVVTKIGDTLKVSPNNQPVISLSPLSLYKFIDKEHPEISMEFVNIDGKIKKVILSQEGRIMEATKLELDSNYNPEKKYSIEQLKKDFILFRDILEKFHPRLYEFTPKEEFNIFFDSLYTVINKPMNEIEFRYFLLPAVAKVHCGHTILEPSYQLAQYRLSLVQPFVLYYEGDKAYIRYSADPRLKPGIEVLDINGEPIKTRIENVLKRVSGDGIHSSVQYALINQPMSWFQYEMPTWFNMTTYKLRVIGPDKVEEEIISKAISPSEFGEAMLHQIQKKHHTLNILDDNKVAILTYPSIDFPIDSNNGNFVDITFQHLKEKNIPNLIIDLRGNGGGSPDNAVYLLKYLMKKEFVYSITSDIPHFLQWTKPTSIAENRFNGKIYFLMDGLCASSTGHLLSMIKYYSLGPLIGEQSGAGFSSNTNGDPNSLLNTGLILKCPRGIYETAVKGFTRDIGIVPDYEVENALNDIISGKDPILDFALKQIYK